MGNEFNNNDFTEGFEIGLLLGNKSKSGGSSPISDDEWTYPADWIQMPDPMSNQIIGVFDTTVEFKCSISTDTYIGEMTIDWGDGTVEVIPDNYSIVGHTIAAGTGMKTANESTQVMVKITSSSTRKGVGFTPRTRLLAIEYGSEMKLSSMTSALEVSPILHYAKFFGKVCPSIDGDFHRLCCNCPLLRVFDTVVPMTEIKASMFFACPSLEKIDLTQVTIIEDSAFIDGNNLRNLNIPLVTSIGKSAFASCKALRKVNAPLLKSIGYNSFGNCPSLWKFIAPLLETIDTYGFTNNIIEVADFPNLISVKEDGFQYCKALRQVIHADDCVFETGAFQDCPMLYPIPT